MTKRFYDLRQRLAAEGIMFLSCPSVHLYMIKFVSTVSYKWEWNFTKFMS